MLDAQQWVVERLKTHTLPDDIKSFIDLARNSDSGCFELQENTYWDYKDQFPHSMSDEYFWGICRLVCGFHNRYGGFIIFGVHDTDRTPGHNRVVVNIERLNTRLREVLNEPVECCHRRYSFSTGKPLSANQYQSDCFDIVLVPKRKFSTPVVRFRTNTDKYRAADIFIRQNHEVVRAKSADITELYSPRSSFGLEQEDSEARIPSMLPQRPSVLRQFIGRTKVLDDVFAWFVTREDARAFLHGAGGSGKSTIAFEFASIVGRHGADIQMEWGGKIERVIYLTAKERELDTKTGKIRRFIGADFSSADELFRNILLLAEWSSSERIEKLSPEEVRKELRELFDLQSLLIVIDDIDTLYTKRIDDGSEFLITTLARAKSRSKILYTMRQMPSLSIASAIEVPGLEPNGEYEDFINSCCSQFNAQLPPAELIAGQLRKVSDGIPLILETIIALRKTCSSYDEAIRTFQSFGGSDARRYLFSREYNGLQQNNQAKLLLAALALFEKPVSLTELRYALRFDDTVIHDAISAVSEMFLKRAEQADDTTLFTVGEVTRQFILEESVKLDHFELLKSRIAGYQKPFQGKNRDLLILADQIEHLISRGYQMQAIEELEKVRDPEILEHRDFKILAARLYADNVVARFEDARRFYEDLFAMRVRNIRIYQDWVAMERRTDASVHGVCTVCAKVLAADWIKEDEKVFFHFAKAVVQYNHGRKLMLLGSPDAFGCLVEAMNHHLIVCQSQAGIDRRGFEKSEEYSINTMHNLILAAKKLGFEKQLVQYIEEICSRKNLGPLDPTALPLIEFARSISERGSKAELDRTFGYLSRIDAAINKGASRFRSKPLANELLQNIDIKRRAIREALKGAGV